MLSVLFCWACEHGYLWLALLLYKAGANINHNNNYAFRWACLNGHLCVVKWLYKLKAYGHISNTAFRWACLNGHLDVAEWLYCKGANIHEYNNVAIKYACGVGHLHVAAWLLTIDVISTFDVNGVPNENTVREVFDNIIKEIKRDAEYSMQFLIRNEIFYYDITTVIRDYLYLE